LKEKVDDLWKQLPLTEGLLEQQNCNSGEKHSKTLKPLNDLIDTALKKSMDNLRQDVLRNLSDVQGELGAKASADELTLLRDRMDRWARTHTPQSPSNRSASPPMRIPGKARPFTHSSLRRALEEAQGNDSNLRTEKSYDRAKEPTCPSAVNAMLQGSSSTGRLPGLNRPTKSPK